MTIGTIKMTAQQFLQMGEDPPGVRLELVDGEVKVSPSPDLTHSFVDRQLTLILGTFIKENNLGALFGDVDTIFGKHDVRRPDLIYFAKSRLHLLGEKKIEAPPDLCVEIVSPSSVLVDRKQKFRQYERGKVAHYWIVDPTAQTIEGYKLVGGKYRRTGHGKKNDTVRLPPFPELDIPLAELWWRR
jgi:Uma2 family endonuclease